MRKYIIDFTIEAENDVYKLQKTGEKVVLKKLAAFLVELETHPETGTGHPEQLKNNMGVWSRRLTKKHRLVYKIKEEVVTVLVLSSYGHYDDK